MARPLRLDVADGIHHVAARANGGALIFEDDVDRLDFLRCLADVIRRRGWFSLAYCVMGTHYHLLVETPEPNLSDGMRDLNSAFARRWRDRRGSHGHVFGGRFRSKLVQDDAYLLQAARYVLRNPVEAGLCSRPGDWSWSSFSATCNGEISNVVHPGRLLRFFESPVRPAVKVFRSFVEDESLPPYDVTDNGLLGDHVFAAKHLPVPLPSPEIPWRFSTTGRVPLATILTSEHRDQAAASAHLDHGYTQTEIAEALGVHRSTVCRWIRVRATDQT
jgi:REP-associated tyrosine transposase